MPGSGKTTFGKKLAAQLGYQFYDLDAAIELQAGVNISSIFSTFGEAHFRNIEEQVLRATIHLNNVVIATGGGCPAYKENMEWMNKNGFTIYLRAKKSLLAHRISASKQARPLFEGMDLDAIIQKLETLLSARLPFYEQAVRTVDVPVRSAKTLVKSMF